MMATTAERVVSRMEWAGELIAQTPIHVGGGGIEVDTNLPLARDGRGNLFIPGASLAGMLRAACSGTPEDGGPFLPAEIQAIWGGPEQEGCAAVADGIVTLPQGGAIEVREGRRVSGELGVAPPGAAYDIAVLPHGAKVLLRVTLFVREALRGNTSHEQLAAAMLGMLRAEFNRERVRIRLGGATSRGLGRIKFREHVLRRDRLNTRADMLRHLSRRADRGAQADAEIIDTALADEAHAAWQDRLASGMAHERRTLELAVRWRPAGPLMVRSGHDGTMVDILPLITGMDHELALVLPGSSVKGALRARAERILRTVTSPQPHGETARESAVVEDVDSPANASLVGCLFGAPGGHADNAARINPAQPWAGRGALSVDDCIANRPLRFGREQWQKIESAGSARELAQAIDSLARPATSVSTERENRTLQPAYHIAVDRWTGAAASSAIGVLEPHGELTRAWPDMRLSLDWARINPSHQAAALALLLFVLRDLAAGELPLGFGANRGMGAVRVDEITLLFVGGAPTALSAAATRTEYHWTGQGLAGMEQSLVDMLDVKWRQWIESQTGQVQGDGAI